MKNIYLIVTGLTAVLIISAVIIILIVTVRRAEKRFFTYQDKLLADRLQEMNNIYMSVRGFRHDYHNHMQTIKAWLALGRIDEAEKYIDRMENELDKIDFRYKTGNVNVDVIINSKLTLAEKDNIRIKCDAALPARLNGINPVDLCVILGNLTDNAIEACRKMDGDRFIRIYMCVKKQNLYISFTNSTNEIIRKLNREYITNKRGNHGHGLKRIDMAVEKYDGFINRQNEPGVFATEILLPTG